MKVLIACEYSGIVREAFKKRGHEAWSCDILPTEIPGNHIVDDVLNHLHKDWDLINCSSTFVLIYQMRVHVDCIQKKEN